MGLPSHMSTHESTLIGLTDPFSSEASGARYPDQGAGKTLTFQQRLSITGTSDAAGKVAISFNPRVNFPYIVSASIVGSTAEWPIDYSGDVSTNLINTYGNMYRPTSMGLRIANTLSATESAGFIIIAKGGPAVRSGTTTFNPSNFSSWDMHPMVHGGEWHATAHARSSNAYSFKDMSLTGSNAGTADDTWESIFVFISGSKASSSIVIFELFLNYEYVADEDAPIAQLALPQPVMNIPLQTAVNEVQSSHPPSHKGPTSVVRSFIKKEAKKALLKHVLPFAAKKATQLLL